MKFVIFIIFLTKYLISCFNNHNQLSNESKVKKFTNKKVEAKLKTKTKMRSLFSFSTKELLTLKLDKSIKNIERFQGYPIITADTKIEIGPGPVYFQGWNKYFTVKSTQQGKSESMKEFKINTSFSEEQLDEFKKQNPNNNMKIPGEHQFFFILTDTNLNVVSSRYNNLAKTVDIVDIKSLLDIRIDKTGAVKGGIEDLGNFQEGFCFLLRGKSNELYNYKWVICACDYTNKSNLMKKLIILRLRHQVKCGKNEGYENSAITNIKLIDNNMFASSAEINPNISRWINLQDWSSCTLACGGGSQTLHRYCLRESSGKECEGPAVLTRPCNTQPCANITDEVIDTKLLPTEIRIVQVSLRPQRFSKCIIKEEDLDIVRFDIGNLRIPPRIPSRVVMNNRTISIFESGTYDTILASYYLSDLTIIEPYKDDPEKCIKIGTTSHFNILCAMCTDNSNKDVKSWIKDIDDFRNNCWSDRKEFKVKKISDDDPRLINIKKELEAEDLKKKILADRKNDLKKSVNKNTKALQLAQLLALKKLEKENKFEERLEKEELMREQNEDEDLKHEYECEETKKNNLIKALMLKHNYDDSQKNQMKEKLEEIEKETQLKIMLNRKRIMKKIYLLRLAHNRKKNKFREQISDVRKVLTQNMLSADKSGDGSNCINSIETDKYISYCNANFSNDPVSHQDCLNKDHFCYICCENEFGDMHMSERETCLSKCDKKLDFSDAIGRWKFVYDKIEANHSNLPISEILKLKS